MTVREFQDNDIDRTAMGLLIEHYPDIGVDALTADLDAINDAWTFIAKDLARCSARTFDRFEAEFREQEQTLFRTVRPTQLMGLDIADTDPAFPNALLPAVQKVNALLAALAEWRYLTLGARWDQGRS